MKLRVALFFLFGLGVSLSLAYSSYLEEDGPGVLRWLLLLPLVLVLAWHLALGGTYPDVWPKLRNLSLLYVLLTFLLLVIGPTPWFAGASAVWIPMPFLCWKIGSTMLGKTG